MYSLRDYQKQAVIAMRDGLKYGVNDLVVSAQGSGKSLIIGAFAYAVGVPVLILCPTREILAQNREKLLQYVEAEDVGVYSASFNSKHIKKFTLATIGSVYKIPEKFVEFPVVIIDEAHSVPTRGGGMYSYFLKRVNPQKTYGLTATPYRLETLYEHHGNGYTEAHTVTQMVTRHRKPFWHRIICNITTQNLIDQGYLTPGRYLDKTIFKHAKIPANVSKSNFDLAKYEKMLVGEEQKILEAVYLGMELGKHCLVFTTSVEQAEWIVETVGQGAVISAKTKKKDRERLVREFREGLLPMIANVQTMTVGVDFPALDCIVNLRPTRSIALWSQMVGRGSRLHPGKKFYWVIDVANNVKTLGRIETIKIEQRENKWEIVSETSSDWHNKKLFSFDVSKT